MPTEPFFGTADLAYRSMEEAQRRHSSWIELSDEISADPQSTLYFTFDDHRSWSRVLRDDAKANGKRYDGAIIGCEWTRGRWAGKGALSFDGVNDRVRLKLPTPLRSATLTAWICLETLRSEMNPIVCAAPATAGAARWGIDGSGRLVLQLRGKESSSSANYVSSVAFRKERLGRWVHLATTYDAEKQMVSHYVDGRPFSREKTKNELRLLFDKSVMGHTSDRDIVGDKEVYALHGSIDEFSLHRIAFDEEEIRRLYEIGRPYALPPRLIPAFP